MPRKSPAVTINIHFHETGKKHKVELCRILYDRWLVRFDRKNFDKAGNITITELCVKIRKLLKINLNKNQ